MSSESAGQRLRPGDFEQFASWYSTRRQRTSGSPASPSTLRTRQQHLALLSNLAGCADQAELGTLLLDRDRVEYLVDALAARMTPGAVRAYLYSLIAFADYAKARGFVTHVALSRADIPPPNPDPAITTYTREQVERFVSSARGVNLRWWAFLTFVADTGRRAGEVLSLRWTWFRLHDSPAYVELPQNKSRRPQYVPLTRRLRDEVFTADNIEILMGEVRNGRRAFKRSPLEYPFPWTYASVRNRLQHLCAVTGLPYRGLHNFRHTLITERIARGVPLQAVAALAGHSAISTTDRRYNHTNALNFSQYVEPPSPD